MKKEILNTGERVLKLGCGIYRPTESEHDWATKWWGKKHPPRKTDASAAGVWSWAVAWAPPACSVVRVRGCQTWAWSLHQLTAKIECLAVNAAAQDIIYSLICSHLHRGAQHFRYSVPQCRSTSVVPGPPVCTKAGQYLYSHKSRKKK